MIYTRNIYKSLLEHVNQPYVTVLTGMRRTGKTTLVKQLLVDIANKNSLFLDLQRLDNRELFGLKNYDSIYNELASRGLDTNKPIVVALDEIQLAPKAISAIKYLYDTFGVKFIVTGSSSYYLKNVFNESLSGRKKIFELHPLDFGEFLDFKQVANAKGANFNEPFNSAEYARLSTYYEEFITYGGFPQVVLEPDNSVKKDILSDIMSSYIEIDVKSLADFASTDNLYALVKLLAARAGSRIEQTTLARIIGISRPTLMSYLTFLEKTYLISRVSVYSTSSTREIVKAKKIYFCDTGLANIVADLSGGAQFENTVFNQLARKGVVSYFAIKSGQEIDFILKQNDKDQAVALEAKETPVNADTKQLEKLSALVELKSPRLVGRHQSVDFENYIWGGSIR